MAGVTPRSFAAGMFVASNGPRRGGAAPSMATDAYLDNRHPNWLLAEEFGDVFFVAARGVVLVHRDRAEHIARALGRRPQAAQRAEVIALPVRRADRPATAAIVIGQHQSRRRVACGWLGIVAAAAVFVGALTTPLDDPALVVGSGVALRSGMVIVAGGSWPVGARSMTERPCR
jgi:hypothetical protein